ncbi:hypothetical protein TERTU_1812 [Teredinibacter turnerae T7901]|uniref:Uncharacterized protein n=1 Tax=Teredinibacter turnerae (strain ATCC 39867 / T7901) TaxID=377629 RepID=C5BHT1_TERTT|nr:hypothetical protein TERTU_1812 [Teredinibacter turnerae T7901]
MVYQFELLLLEPKNKLFPWLRYNQQIACMNNLAILALYMYSEDELGNLYIDLQLNKI